jgi:hypothetical protein
MEEREEELLRGMGNCYAACHASFEETIGMVGSSRDLTPEEVVRRLRSMRERYSGDSRYRTLRARFPADFPV